MRRGGCYAARGNYAMSRLFFVEGCFFSMEDLLDSSVGILVSLG